MVSSYAAMKQIHLLMWNVTLVPHLLFKATWFNELQSAENWYDVYSLYICLVNRLRLCGRNKPFGANLRHVKWRAWDVDCKSVRLTFAELKTALANNSNDGYPVSYRCRTNSVNLCGNICDRVVRRALGQSCQKQFLPPFMASAKQYKEI
jgi:hypothetical protein